MAVMLPPVAAGMMSLLGPWPNIDEDQIRAEAGTVRRAHAATVLASAGSESAVRGTQQVHHGRSAAALAAYWERNGAQSGHVAQANTAMRWIPPALEGTASVVSGVKVAAATQAVFTTVDVARLLATGGVLGAAAATARILLGRQAVGKILREGSEGTGKVLAPLLQRKITDPMRGILDDLKPRGPMGPRLAVAGPHGGVPMRPLALKPSTPSPVGGTSVAFGRKKPDSGGRGRGGGRGGGRGVGRLDGSGKFHGGIIPQSTRGMTAAEKEKLKKDLEASLARRRAEEERLGYEAGHAERIRREQAAYDKLFKGKGA